MRPPVYQKKSSRLFSLKESSIFCVCNVLPLRQCRNRIFVRLPAIFNITFTQLHGYLDAIPCGNLCTLLKIPGGRVFFVLFRANEVVLRLTALVKAAIKHTDQILDLSIVMLKNSKYLKGSSQIRKKKGGFFFCLFVFFLLY